MISNKDVDLISALDLNPIKVKLMHKESGEGWSLEKADGMETEYRRFLYLMKAFPNEQTAPLVDVDTFWHYHILDTMKYARDCEQAFGYFLHHYPYLGLEGEDGADVQGQAGDRMRELYEATFGEAYLRSYDAAGAWCGRAPETGVSTAANTAWCGRAPVKAEGTQTAWCGRAPEAGVSTAANTAWCGRAPVKAEEAQTAWCGRAPVEAEGAQTAWCGRAPVKAETAQTAWCGRAPALALAA
ncbi:glycine-rich domain-containing protein-like [Massilia sp. CMS3.1]|uniref:glycine-rich domain-containing protein-like n=1 Tax=Massilia sp. CMS3.1 TaxID=3373083 RepID=UPI003EE54558